jgi:exosortase/archaeosortase family protein
LSLATLWRDLGGQTPLAMIGLAPMLALALLAAGLARRAPLRPPGRIDLLAGSALLLAAGAIVLIGPSLASVYFWVARLDVLSLPLFVAGALLLLFGWRVLFVSRAALVLLILAWPLPSLVLVENTAEALTAVTAAALAAIVRFVPIASIVEGSSATFTVAYTPDPFLVQVATACAGMNSSVAFLLVGGAFAMFLEGRILAKVAWLGLGLALVFGLNVVRVVALVAIGAAWGPVAALELFHPVAGLLALAGGLFAMILLLPRFGLRAPVLRPGGPAALPEPGAEHAVVQPQRSRRSVARAALLLGVAALFGMVNGTFAAFEQGPNSGVAAPLAPRATAEPGETNAPQHEPARIGDRVVLAEDEITVGTPYFGSDSEWIRYKLARAAGAPEQDRYAMWLDVITVSDRQRLVDFGVEECYRFHGQSIDASQTVSLGHGVVAQIVETAFLKNGRHWLVLWWEHPVQVGSTIQHERVVLLAPAAATPTEHPIQTPDGPLLMVDLGTAVPEAHRALANDLIALGTTIVAGSSLSGGTTR